MIFLSHHMWAENNKMIQKVDHSVRELTNKIASVRVGHFLLLKAPTTCFGEASTYIMVGHWCFKFSKYFSKSKL